MDTFPCSYRILIPSTHFSISLSPFFLPRRRISLSLSLSLFLSLSVCVRGRLTGWEYECLDAKAFERSIDGARYRTIGTGRALARYWPKYLAAFASRRSDAERGLEMLTYSARLSVNPRVHRLPISSSIAPRFLSFLSFLLFIVLLPSLFNS